MDWSRAKTILIAVFVMLNLLLGYQLWYDRAGTSEATPELQETELALEQIIARKNIRIKAALPVETPKLRERTVKVSPPDGEPATMRFKEPFAADLLKQPSEMKGILSKKLPDGESYTLSSIESSKSKYTLHQMLDGYPLFDMELDLFAENDEVYGYKQLHAELLTGALHQEQKVLDAITAVTKLADKFLKVDAVIVDVALGYHGQAFNSETRVLAPYWRVLTEQGDRYFVHAITGDVE